MDFDKYFSGLSITELARITGIHKSRWSRYLSGKVGISERTLNRMAEKLEIKASELLKLIDERRRV